MTQETEKPNAPDPDEAAQGKRKTARKLYQQKIARNPKWRDTTMAAGRGFVIGGAKPPKEVSG
jgi:hypothetical protein